MERGCGLYMPVKDISDKCGYGCFSKKIYEFIDFLSEQNIKYWQIDELAIKTSKNTNLSSFAIDPMYLDESKFLVDEEIDFFGLRDKLSEAEYFEKKNEALKYVFDKHYYMTNIDKFISDNEYWVYDFAVYQSLKEELGVTYKDFPLFYKNLDSKETISFIKTHSEEIIYPIFIQNLLAKQWKEIKKYASTKGVKIIAKISERCSLDSSDVYSKPKYFNLDTFFNASEFVCFNKDGFSDDIEIKKENPNLDTSELVYNDDVMKKDRYEWWLEKLTYLSKVYDYIIIDNNLYNLAKYNKDENSLTNTSESERTFTPENFEWFKNNAIKNLIIGNENDLDNQTTAKTKLNYPLRVSFEKLCLSQNNTSNTDDKFKSIIEDINKNTLITLSEENDFIDLLNDKNLKNNVCKILNLSSEEDNANILKIAIESMLSSNANVCIISMKDILTIDKNSKEKVESGVQLNYQSKKYFEYLKQLIANKNR